MQLQQNLHINNKNLQWWLSLLHLLKSMGYPSFFTTMISFLIHYYKRYDRMIKRSIANGPTTKLMNPSASATKLIHRRATTSSPLNILGHRFLDAFRLKKKIVISMKNTLLWNPSSDINAPNYAFKENAINLIQKLSTSHHLYLLMHYNSTEEYAQIQHIFDNNATINCAVQKDNILFCASVADKLNFLDRIRPDIYVEGDTGHKDGSETIWILLQENHIDVVPKVIWIDGSFAARPLNFMDQATKLQNDRLEYAESVFQSSIASLTK